MILQLRALTLFKATTETTKDLSHCEPEPGALNISASVWHGKGDTPKHSASNSCCHTTKCPSGNPSYSCQGVRCRYSWTAAGGWGWRGGKEAQPPSGALFSSPLFKVQWFWGQHQHLVHALKDTPLPGSFQMLLSSVHEPRAWVERQFHCPALTTKMLFPLPWVREITTYGYPSVLQKCHTITSLPNGQESV